MASEVDEGMERSYWRAVHTNANERVFMISYPRPDLGVVLLLVKRVV